MIRRTTTRLLLILSLAGLPTLLFMARASAAVPDNVAVYSGAADASGMHVYFEPHNQATKVADNRYPLAEVSQGAGPSSQGRASNQEAGPAWDTVVSAIIDPWSADPCSAPVFGPSKVPCPPGGIPGHQTAPYTDYARVQFPPGVDPADATCCAAQGGYGEAHARELTANAFGLYSGAPSFTGAPAVKNSTAETKTVLNDDGSIVITTHSHVSSADFGGPNGLVIKDVDVVASVKSAAGKATATATVAPGSTYFAGKPFSVPTNGATQTGNITDPSGKVGGPVTYKIYVVAPDEHTDGPHGSVHATGTHVRVTTPDPGGNTFEYVFGEGIIPDSYVIPAEPAPLTTIDLSGFPSGSDLGSLGSEPSTTTYTPPSATAAPPSSLISRPRTRTRGTALAALDRPNLAVMFFIWEAIVLATAGSIVWSRRVRLRGDEA